jgi:hypothetical protein
MLTHLDLLRSKKIDVTFSPILGAISFSLDDGVRGKQPCFKKSFGDLNADKTFYVIWISGGAGFFSNLSLIICQILVAKDHGFIPVVDLECYPTFYHEDKAIFGSKNPWCYYFEQLQKVSIEEVYQSKNVVFSSGKYPNGFSYSITAEKDLFERVWSGISLRAQVDTVLSVSLARLTSRTLGIHFRGQEQKTAAAHWFPATVSQMLYWAEKLMVEHMFDRIFLVTEEQQYLDIFKEKFGPALLVFNDSFRTYSENAYLLPNAPRPNHFFLLGLEVLIDALTLSNCAGLLSIGSGSNVSCFASFVNNKSFAVECRINNGPNSSDPEIARTLFAEKVRNNQLPEVIELIMRRGQNPSFFGQPQQTQAEIQGQTIG